MGEVVRYVAKAVPGKKSRMRAAAVIAAVTAAVCAGAALMVYSLVKGSVFFCIGYFIAAALGVCYIIIEINSMFSTYIAADASKLYMKNWTNGFVPYDVHCKIAFVREFMPAKTAVVEIRLADIKECLVGSVNFVKRYCHDNYDFIDAAERFEKLDFLSKSGLKRMDLFYVETKSGESCFMPVTGFDTAQTVKLLNYIEKRTKAQIRCNSREMVRMRKNLGAKI